MSQIYYIINLNNNLIPKTYRQQMQHEQHITQILTCKSQQQIQHENIYEEYVHEQQLEINNKYNQMQYQLENIYKIIKRIYSRRFIKGLTFAWILALRNQEKYCEEFEKNRNHLQTFGSLVIKKQRNSEEQQMLVFLNHCATLIQSKFKSYITRKRHIIALKKVKKAKILSSFIEGWKTYRVYNCGQIVMIRKKIKQINNEIDKQQQDLNNRSAKKLVILYQYIKINYKIFSDTFNAFMETGMWTLQKYMKPKILKKYTKNILQIKPIRQITQKLIYEKKIQKQQKIIIRQQKIMIKQQQKIIIKQQKKQNIHDNGQIKSVNKLYSNQTNHSSFQDRPIQTAGKYKFTQQQQQKLKNTQIISQINKKQIQNVENDKQIKIKQKNKKYQQLQKRNKYDPRKAIQDQKKKKKQIRQLQKNKFQQINQLSINPSIQQNKIKQIDKITQKINQQDHSIDKNKKTIKAKKQKNQIQNKKFNHPHPKTSSIKNISSKVDCWVNKKQQQPEWVKQYKLRILQRNKKQNQQSQQKPFDDPKPHQKPLHKKTQQPQKYSKKPQQQSQNKKMGRIITQPQKKKNTIQTWQQRQKKIQHLKEKQNQYVDRRKYSGDSIQDQVKALIQKKNMLKKKQMHRPIQQLQQAYNKHYGDRFQNLMPKLSLLAVARSQQGTSCIPVIAEQGNQFNQWFQQIYKSTQFWKKAAEHQKIYKSFILP